MSGKLLIGMGNSSFKKRRLQHEYYVDKTEFVEEVFQSGEEVQLYSRPRRFGKTLNLSMLRYFLDIEAATENRKLFHGLKIEKSKYWKEQGKYPVIFLSLKEIQAENFAAMKKKMLGLLKSLYNDFAFLREELNESELLDFDDLWLARDEEKLEMSLLNLSYFLEKYYQKHVVVLMDEYDTPLISAYKEGFYEEALAFFKRFYSAALKDNENLKFAVLTGIVRVVKAGIFSDLNNLSVHTVLDKEHKESFGLLEEEVEEVLRYYDLHPSMEKVKYWYNGYQFGEAKVYNPWSILRFVSKRELGSYWIDTSENYLIKDVLSEGNPDVFEKLNTLLLGKSIAEEITGRASLSQILDSASLWELLLFSGYLTVDEKIERNLYQLKIPNREVREFFGDSFIDISK